MGVSFNWLFSSASLATCIGGALYYLLFRKNSELLRASPVSFSFFRKKLLVTQEDKKLGLRFSYCPTEYSMHSEVRAFPAAFFELKPVNDGESAILISVEEFEKQISLAEHKTFTYNAIAMHLAHVEIECENAGGLLGGCPCVEFEYSYTSDGGMQRKSWCAIAVSQNRAYSIHSHSNVANAAQEIRICRQIASSMQIFEQSHPESHVYFTEPRFGLGVEIPQGYSLQYDSNEHEHAIVRFNLDPAKGHSGKSTTIELDHLSALHPKTLDSRTLDVAVTTIRGMIENTVGPNQRLEWQTGTVLDDAALVYLKQSMTIGSFEYDFVSKLSRIPGKYFFYDFTMPVENGGSGDTKRFVAFVVLTAFGVFRLTVSSSLGDFSKAFVDANECLHALTFGNQYGQECSLVYKNPRFLFSIRVPTHYHVQETVIGDPVVIVYPSEQSSGLDTSGSSPEPPFTIDVSTQLLSESDAFESCALSYHEYLQKHESISGIEQKETVVDRRSAIEFVFHESLKEAEVRVAVVLVVYDQRQFSIQLTAQTAAFEYAYKQFVQITETFRFMDSEGVV